MPENPVISNTSPLVGLWTLGLLHLLRDLYTEVLIPEEVQDEFLATEISYHDNHINPINHTVRTEYLDICHAETGTVFVAETAVVTRLYQDGTARDMERTQHASNLDPLIVHETGNTTVASVDVIGIETEG